jgi:outer membrane protein TolC
VYRFLARVSTRVVTPRIAVTRPATPAIAARTTTWSAFAVALGMGAIPVLNPDEAQAQQPPAALSLEEAIGLALRHNPAFQANLAEEAEADWAVREAYGALLPGASANMGFQYQASGEPRFGAVTGTDFGVQQQPSFLLSDYTLGVSYQFGGHTVYRPGQARAQRPWAGF